MMRTNSFFSFVDSPFGKMLLTANEAGITGLYTSEHADYKVMQKGIFDHKPFTELIRQLDEYFAGCRRDFDLKLAPEGTDFQKQVWELLLAIPYGETVSYSQLAQILNTPNASRAVGSANAKNPFLIVVPCHRVVGASGDLTGYAGGLQAKRWLLKHESRVSGNLSEEQLCLF